MSLSAKKPLRIFAMSRSNAAPLFLELIGIDRVSQNMQKIANALQNFFHKIFLP